MEGWWTVGWREGEGMDGEKLDGKMAGRVKGRMDR